MCFLATQGMRDVQIKRDEDAERISVKLPRNRHGGAPLSRPLSASTRGWTARAPIGGWLILPYGAWMASPTWYRAIARRTSPAGWTVGTTIGRRRGRRERAGTPTPLCAPRQGTLIPGGFASGRPRPCAPSCHLPPTRCGWRWYAHAGDERRAHQPLPTDRTAFGRRFHPMTVLVWPI